MSAAYEAAVEVLNEPAVLPKAAWPRAVALLLRQALERGVASYVATAAPGLEQCSATAQLICLPWYVADKSAGRQAHETWAALSNACHHHAYDLAPTASELQRWADEVDVVLRALARGSVTARG